MTPTTRLVLALGAASAYSAFPAAYYHHVQEATGSAWSTPVLFAAHGLAQVAAMTVVGRLRPRTAAPGRVVAALLLADAAGALLLVAAPEPGGFALLLAGRVVTGAALGALAPVATAGIVAHPRGPALATVAILGAVGAGSLVAGALAAAGWSRAAVLAVGLVLLPAAAWLVRGVAMLSPMAAVPSRHEVSAVSTVRGEVTSAAGAEGVRHDVDTVSAVRSGHPLPDAAPRTAPAPARPVPVLACAVLAFAANGVLGLFCSTLPGVVAGLAGGASAVAGATTGIVMLSAGGARLLLGGMPTRRVLLVAALAAAAGLAGLTAGLASGVLGLVLACAALLGAAAGTAFDSALRAVAPSGVHGLARVQRGGQLGLVVPVLLYPVLIAPVVTP